MAIFLKKLWTIITTIVLILVIVLAILLVGVRLVGIEPYTVLSGSMEPTYHVGSLIYVKEVDVNDLKVDEPITFYLDGSTVATHRIVEILPDTSNPDAIYFRTKGDANDSVDSNLIHSSKVIGKPIFTVPYLGYFSNFLQQPEGFKFAIIAIAGLFLFIFIPDLLFKKKD